MVALVLLVIYLLLYGILRWMLPVDSPGRKRADRWLWCWYSLYDGQACCFYNVIFSPFVLTIHAAWQKLGAERLQWNEICRKRGSLPQGDCCLGNEHYRIDPAAEL